MKRLRLWALLLILTVGFVLSTRRPPAVGQAPPPEEALRQARELIGDSDYDRAVELLEQVSAANPGTNFDASSRLTRAYVYGASYHNFGQARTLYDSVVRDFPGTVNAYFAETSLADLDLMVDGKPFADWLERMDGAIQSAGGVGLQPILRGSRRGPRPVPGLDTRTQEALLYDAYTVVSSRMSSRPMEERTLQLKEQSLELLLYVRETFPSVDDGLDQTIRRRRYWEIEGRNTLPDDTTPPVILKLHPKDGARTGPRPQIRIRSVDGDESQAQLTLNRTMVKLDGIEIPLEQLEIRIKRARYWQKHTNAEDVWMRWRPSDPLQPGPHVLEVRLQDGAGNATSQVSRFTSAGTPCPDDDQDWSW